MKNIQSTVHFLSFAFYFGWVGLMWFTGGILSPVFIWSPLFIFYTYPRLGKKWTVFWVSLWVLTSILFWKLDSIEWLPTNILSRESARDALFLSVLTMLPLGFWLSSIQQKKFDDLKEISRQRRAESSNFLRVISHDIRSPLQIIQSYTYLLKNDKGEKKLAFLESIEKSVQQISGLLGQVRDFETLMNPKVPLVLGPVDLREVVENTIKTQALNFSHKDLQVKVEFDAATFKVLSHREVLGEHILGPILNNAFKFTAPKKEHHHEGTIQISAKKQAKTVTLTIRDDGLGIPTEQLQNIFEFSKKGSGFGLPITKLYLEQLKITAQLQSWTENSPPYSRGTEFKLTFQLIE